VQANYANSVKGLLNFAADKNDGGQFSNTRPERTRQNLQPLEVEIRNGRSWPRSPTLENEGLTLVRHASGSADWSNRKWIDADYVPSCVELVKQLTGAKTAMAVYAPLQRRVNYEQYKGAVPTAGFVHIDQTRDIALAFAGQLAAAHGVTLESATIYNVWKCMTPPPQDCPLAVSDRNSISVVDHVPGETVEFLGEKEEKLVSPYVLLSPCDKQIYYYFPDMVADESLVFIGVDLDPSRPLGCAHSAFRYPASNGTSVPRASIETRVLAIFD
jgi:hypothetical protein